tara:strand:+ start:915 stop:1505 length:591 start_codon:yes stop_codon:yes gene_type:complete
MIKQLRVNFPLFKSKFIDHEKIKNSVKEKIIQSDFNSENILKDTIEKFDWKIADNFERAWVKEIIPSMYNQLNLFANKMGFKEVIIEKIWFQQYKKNSLHDWHVHGNNYTGVYYLELPENDITSLTQFLYPDNLKNGFCIDAKEGDILFFPSFLIHRAPYLQSSKKKIVVSWNCNFNGINEEFLKEIENLNFIEFN